jgi:hypothetical protein
MTDEVKSHRDISNMKRHEIVLKLDQEKPMFLDPTGNHVLNSPWVLWSHDHKSQKWGVNDYRKHAVIRTMEDFWSIYNGLPSLLNKDMWFLMREGIPPLWEHPINQEGGSWQFRIDGVAADNTWLTLSIHLVTENICLKQEDANLICGISISPKEHNVSTISVWNLSSSKTSHTMFPSNIDGVDFTQSRYKPHRTRKLGGI